MRRRVLAQHAAESSLFAERLAVFVVAILLWGATAATHISSARPHSSTTSPQRRRSHRPPNGTSGTPPVVTPTPTDPYPCLRNASSPAYNASACARPPEERWVVWELHSTLAVAVGGVVVAILIAAVAFILHHRQQRRRLLQRASSGYSATSFNSSINEAHASESHANPALQHTNDVYDIDEFSLDNDSFLHTLESFECAQRTYGGPNAVGTYGRMRSPPVILHAASSAVAPAPLSKTSNTLDPLSLRSITPATSTISSAGSAAVTKTLSRGNV